MSSKRKIGVYVAKYSAKRSPSLDFGTYPKVPGRHWGMLRKSLLPLAPLVRYENLDAETVTTLKAVAAAELAKYERDYNRGFCLMGAKGEKWADAFGELLLDTVPRSC